LREEDSTHVVNEDYTNLQDLLKSETWSFKTLNEQTQILGKSVANQISQQPTSEEQIQLLKHFAEDLSTLPITLKRGVLAAFENEGMNTIGDPLTIVDCISDDEKCSVFIEPAGKFSVLSSAVSRIMIEGRASAALDIAQSGESKGTGMVIRAIVDRWATENLHEASKYVSQMEAGVSRDHAAVSLIPQLLYGDNFEGALAWAEAIQDIDTKLDMIEVIERAKGGN